MRKGKLRKWPRLLAGGALAAATLWLLAAAATAEDAASAARAVQRELPIEMLRYTLGEPRRAHALSTPAAVALRFLPALRVREAEVTAAWSSELQQQPVGSEEQEGTLLTKPPTEAERNVIVDNGVPARTLRPSDPQGYVIAGEVYVNNASDCALSASMLEGEPAALHYGGGPQVLIVHTHGTEAYTMPAGEEYVPSDDHRTLEEEKNMLRIGDEIAARLERAGLEVLHDRTPYDYPNYSGAYNRSLAAVEAWREKYPSLLYVLDVHRDAVTDAEGNQYKLVSEEGAAQMEFVIGSSGGGLKHEHWVENLKLACAVQETLLAAHPTLMRPIVVRNSRYNQQVTAGALLIEVGAAGNSLDEALFAARLFADGFAATVRPALDSEKAG